MTKKKQMMTEWMRTLTEVKTPRLAVAQSQCHHLVNPSLPPGTTWELGASEATLATFLVYHPVYRVPPVALMHTVIV